MEISKVAAIIEGRTVQELTRLCGESRSAFSHVLSEDNMAGIAARLGRSAVFRLANECIFPHPAEPLNDVQLIDKVTDAVDAEFDAWWARRDVYKPIHHSQSEQRFIEEHGDIDWGRAQTSRSIIASDESDELLLSTMQPLCTEDGLQSKIGAVAECVTNLEHMFGIDPKMRAVFERVRTAEYGKVTKSNVDDLIQKIRGSYNKAWLEPGTIELLRNNDPDNLEVFSNKTAKGVFIFGFDESVGGKPTIAEQMYTDFTTERKEGEPTYEGRYLMDDRGELLAWFTYWQTPRFPSETHRSMLKTYLRDGVTGGSMLYRRDPPKKSFERNIDNTMMIDTLRGAFPFAASRLVAKMAQEVHSFNPNISTILGYRIHSISMLSADFKPAFPGFREPIRNTENLNSSTFFGDRGCAPFAYDYKKDGSMSRRQLSNDREIFLNPEWVAFSGNFQKFLKKSRSLWHKTQERFGDVTGDL